MKNYGYYLLGLLVVGGLLFAVLYYALCAAAIAIDEYDSVSRPARIHPDYTDTIIPPNIAPLNFLVDERGSLYCVNISSKQGNAIEIFSRKAKIIIPQRPWRKLLEANRGNSLYFDVYVRDETGRWSRFAPITNMIAEADIDRYLVYRLIKPIYNMRRETSIHQRDLQNYDEWPVLSGLEIRQEFWGACVNCHAFCNNRTDKMTVGVRSGVHGSSLLLALDGRSAKVDTKFGYTAWHPSGRLVMYSINKVRQFFHEMGTEVRDVVDLDSFLAYYLIKSRKIKTNPNIAVKDRLETYPAWSPDGGYLYYCSAPILWTDKDKIPPVNYKKVRYDLMRISYDINSDSWGEPETILSAEQTGKSILLPRISPDGRFLLFCMCDYGCFPIYQPSSDLYIMDLEAAQRTGQLKYRFVDINSDRCESWHSWSSNSRWIVFSSKRRDGLFTRSYLSYVDKDGKVYKPLLMPQKDPTFYDSFLKTYSVPELVIEPVKTRKDELAATARSVRKIAVELPITMATPKAGAFPTHEEPWQERE